MEGGGSPPPPPGLRLTTQYHWKGGSRVVGWVQPPPPPPPGRGTFLGGDDFVGNFRLSGRSRNFPLTKLSLGRENFADIEACLLRRGFHNPRNCTAKRDLVSPVFWRTHTRNEIQSPCRESLFFQTKKDLCKFIHRHRVHPTALLEVPLQRTGLEGNGGTGHSSKALWFLSPQQNFCVVLNCVRCVQ